MVLAELRPVAFVEDKGDALVAQGFQLFLEALLAVFLLLFVALAVFIKCQPELLDGADDHLVGIVVREQAADKGCGVGVFLYTAFLKLVELLACLPVQVFSVYNEEALVDVRIVLQER